MLYEVHILVIDRYDRYRPAVHAYTQAVSEKQALNNVKYKFRHKLVNCILRDIQISEVLQD